MTSDARNFNEFASGFFEEKPRRESHTTQPTASTEPELRQRAITSHE
jgi:hypothetical protein